ncbi:hypothetical protein OSC52_09575 [Clostridium pasteurianum]|uniref:hypothetical protein n=1 Tax=Clostridium pasteurianum TaxID=1501 RepID=UPI002260FD8A|nr:hypothetical protein [Clostridium pasteurianum]UZW16042.1 hypothetical protein OSC52_09575 [Clostridium pasteurianum]
MTHKNIYFKIVKEKNIQLLNKIFKEQGLIEYHHIDNIQFMCKNDFPYILITENNTGRNNIVYAAKYIGLFLNLQKIIVDYKQLYYLPVIAIPAEYDKYIEKYVEKHLAIEHELIHVKDILQIIDTDDKYLSNVYNYALSNIKSVENIEKSIDFEIYKIFKLEPRALSSDYKGGLCMIYSDFIFGIAKYKCTSLEEYLQMEIYNYLSNLKSTYIEKFENNKKIIENIFKEKINKYGNEIYGENPYAEYKKVKDEFIHKLLKYSTENM